MRIVANIGVLALLSCSTSVNVSSSPDASPDATELDASPDASSCPVPNPGPVPCEDAASCPVLPIASCGEWKCPKSDGGQSFCKWSVKDGGL